MTNVNNLRGKDFFRS